VLFVRLYHPALFIRVIIFVKTVLSVVPMPQPSLRSNLSSRPACTSLSSAPGLCPSFQPWLSGPASRGRNSAACPKHPFLEGRGGGCSAGSLSPGFWGRGPCTTPPFLLHQTKGPVFPNLLPLFTCQMAPAHVPIPFPSPEPCSVCLSILCALCAVTASPKPPLILCSNNGALPTPAHRAPLGF
jgi:hypothetical protein